MELCTDVTSTGEEFPVGMHLRMLSDDLIAEILYGLRSLSGEEHSKLFEKILYHLRPLSIKERLEQFEEINGLRTLLQTVEDLCKRNKQNRPESPEPSCVSMKSDQSKNFPPSFNLQHSTVHQETSDVSTDRRRPLDSVFMYLEENVVGFVKKELKKFKGMLSPDYPECPEDQCEDEGVVDEEEAQRRYSSKLVLDMTLLFMRRMNLGELAACLEKRSMRLIQSVAKNTKQNAAFPGLMSAISMVFSTCLR